MRVRVGLIGDYDPQVTAHRAIALALARAAESNKCAVYAEWINTARITYHAVVEQCDALWCVPATPYENTEGALLAIRYAREQGVPFLGTCGGFQHAMIEYARNMWGMADAAHAETNPDAPNQVIVPLSCSMVEVLGRVRFVPGTRLATIYGVSNTEEGYHCNYGLSPRIAERLAVGSLRASAHDQSGDVRAVELKSHPFFVATLFQPERRALRGAINPLVDAFVAAGLERRALRVANGTEGMITVTPALADHAFR
jgi:CTP synthase (UTP-ammonia lyase)